MSERVAGRVLDAEVAERVMGLVPCTADTHKDGSAQWSCHALPETPDQGGETREYSSDIAAAWQVVEKMREQGWLVSLESGVGIWLCRMVSNFDRVTNEAGHSVARRGASAYESNAPLAICLAALEASNA